jgi:flagellar basal body-associated protein FliL
MSEDLILIIVIVIISVIAAIVTIIAIVFIRKSRLLSIQHTNAGQDNNPEEDLIDTETSSTPILTSVYQYLQNRAQNTPRKTSRTTNIPISTTPESEPQPHVSIGPTT